MKLVVVPFQNGVRFFVEPLKQRFDFLGRQPVSSQGGKQLAEEYCVERPQVGDASFHEVLISFGQSKALPFVGSVAVAALGSSMIAPASANDLSPRAKLHGAQPGTRTLAELIAGHPGATFDSLRSFHINHNSAGAQRNHD